MTVFAVDAGDFRFDFIALVERRAGVLDALARNLRGAQIALDARRQLHRRALCRHLPDRAFDRAALAVGGDENHERVLGHLLQTERDALAPGVHRQHHHGQFVALFELGDHLVAGPVPRQIRQMHQTVDAALDADENAEVGDGADAPGDDIAFLVRGSEFLPRIGRALLHAERHASAFRVDVQHHDFHLVADMADLAGVDVAVGPVHLRQMHQALDAFLDFHERAVVGDVGDLAEQAAADRLAARQVQPRVLAELLQAERDAALFTVEFQHPRLDFVADAEHFGRMLDPPPRHVGDVQQAVQAAEVDECAVFGEVLDHAFDDLPFLQGVQQFFALLGQFVLDDGAARDHDVVPPLVEFDNFEFQFAALDVRRVLDRADIHQRAGQKRAQGFDFHREAALDLAGDDAVHHGAVLKRLREFAPGAGAQRALARHAGVAETVLDRL